MVISDFRSSLHRRRSREPYFLCQDGIRPFIRKTKVKIQLNWSQWTKWLSYMKIPALCSYRSTYWDRSNMAGRYNTTRWVRYDSRHWDTGTGTPANEIAFIHTIGWNTNMGLCHLRYARNLNYTISRLYENEKGLLMSKKKWSIYLVAWPPSLKLLNVR